MMQNPTPSQPPSSSGIPKAAWIAAAIFGAIIVALLAAVLYKLSAPAAPSAALSMPAAMASSPMSSGSALVGNNPRSAVAVTSANPESPSSSQFAPMQPLAGTSPQQVERRPSSKHETAGRRDTQSARAAAGSTAEGGTAPQTFAPQPIQPACANCGTVLSVTPVQEQGQANGVGAVVGGLVGGLLGNQIGGGNGRTAATVVGAVGGGFAGNEVQKRVNAHTVYRVEVRMDDGQVRTSTLGAAPPVGQRVQLGANGGLNPIQ